VSRYQKKYSPTHTYHGHQSSLIGFLNYYDPWHPPCSIYVPDSFFPQSLSKFPLVYLLAWHPQLHTPYISSSNHCLLFTLHAHTIATCYAVVPRFCHLMLVSLSLNPLLGTISNIPFSFHWCLFLESISTFLQINSHFTGEPQLADPS